MILVHSRDCEQLLWNQSWLPLLRLYFLFSYAFRATSPCTLRSTQRPQNHKQLCPVWSLLHWGSARSLHVKPGMRWSPRDKADPQPSHSGGWRPLPLLAHLPRELPSPLGSFSCSPGPVVLPAAPLMFLRLDSPQAFLSSSGFVNTSGPLFPPF